jgi:hypothetical protein
MLECILSGDILLREWCEFTGTESNQACLLDSERLPDCCGTDALVVLACLLGKGLSTESDCH